MADTDVEEKAAVSSCSDDLKGLNSEEFQLIDTAFDLLDLERPSDILNNDNKDVDKSECQVTSTDDINPPTQSKEQDSGVDSQESPSREATDEPKKTTKRKKAMSTAEDGSPKKKKISVSIDKNISEGSEDLLLFDDSKLPRGWTRKVVQRKSGQSAGKFDVYVFSPDGKKLRSRVEVQSYLDENGITDIPSTDIFFGKANRKGMKTPKKEWVAGEDDGSCRFSPLREDSSPPPTPGRWLDDILDNLEGEVPVTSDETRIKESNNKFNELLNLIEKQKETENTDVGAKIAGGFGTELMVVEESPVSVAERGVPGIRSETPLQDELVIPSQKDASLAFLTNEEHNLSFPSAESLLIKDSETMELVGILTEFKESESIIPSVSTGSQYLQTDSEAGSETPKKDSSISESTQKDRSHSGRASEKRSRKIKEISEKDAKSLFNDYGKTEPKTNEKMPKSDVKQLLKFRKNSGSQPESKIDKVKRVRSDSKKSESKPMDKVKVVRPESKESKSKVNSKSSDKVKVVRTESKESRPKVDSNFADKVKVVRPESNHSKLKREPKQPADKVKNVDLESKEGKPRTESKPKKSKSSDVRLASEDKDSRVLSPYFSSFPSRARWIPPKSPYKLVQEILYHDPWKLLVASIFLNRTKGSVAIPLLWEFLERWPTAEETKNADSSEIANLIEPLGLHNKRAKTLVRFSREFVSGTWRRPDELHGIGKYGADSYRIFYLGEWRDVQPNDFMLNYYHDWLWTNASALGL